MSINKVILVGHLGADPEPRYMPSGDAVTSFSVATTDKWKDKTTGEQREATEWHRCSAFGKLAEICNQYLKKGAQVYVEGSLKTTKYTDKEGVERYTTGIRMDTMQMLGSRPAAGDQDQGQAPAAGQQRQAAGKRQAAPPMEDDEIPF